MTGVSEGLVDSGTLDRVARFARNYFESPDLRTRAKSEPRAVLSEHGIEMPADRELRIAANTAETFHVVLPPDPNSVLADDQLVAVAGGTREPNFKSASTIITTFACAS